MKHQIRIVICNTIPCSNWILRVGNLPAALWTGPANTHTQSQCLCTTAQSHRLHLCSQSFSYSLKVEHIHTIGLVMSLSVLLICPTVALSVGTGFTGDARPQAVAAPPTRSGLPWSCHSRAVLQLQTASKQDPDRETAQNKNSYMALNLSFYISCSGIFCLCY